MLHLRYDEQGCTLHPGSDTLKARVLLVVGRVNTSTQLCFLVLLSCMLCCATVKPVQQNAYPQDDMFLEGDSIIMYSNDKVFAELRYFMTYKKSNQHRGIAIYYYATNNEVWIYPLEGWQIRKDGKEYTSLRAVESFWLESQTKSDFNERKRYEILFGNKRPDKSDMLNTWVFDVNISEDGKYIYYKTPGVFFNSAHKYFVEYGVTK